MQRYISFRVSVNRGIQICMFNLAINKQTGWLLCFRKIRCYGGCNFIKVKIHWLMVCPKSALLLRTFTRRNVKHKKIKYEIISSTYLNEHSPKQIRNSEKYILYCSSINYGKLYESNFLLNSDHKPKKKYESGGIPYYLRNLFEY